MIYWFLYFGIFTTALSIISYVQGKSFSFVVNAICALINFAQLFFWTRT